MSNNNTNNTNSVQPIAPRVQITLLSNADYSTTGGKLVRGKTGDAVVDCDPRDLADLRREGLVVELDEEQQRAVAVLRRMPDDKRALVRNALGI